MDSVIEHLENHPHAFVKDGVVIGVYLFAEHDENLIQQIAAEQSADTAVSCCVYGLASVNWLFDGAALIPPRPYPSWNWNPDNSQYEAPVGMPNNGKQYNWDESTLQWIEVAND